jgi:DNA invertase Pin-like site-specific DNA recombinase
VAANRKKKAEPAPQAPAEPDQPHMIGYARVSTVDQNPQLQIDALLRAGVREDDIYMEKVSAVAKHRPQFEAMMKDVREGDIVVVWKLDRLGRNNVMLHQIAQRIRDKGANLRLLDNSGLDTSNAAGRLLFGMLSVLAEFEQGINRERTLAGLAAARARGIKGGSKQRKSDDEIWEAGKLGMTAGAASLGYSLSGFIKAYDRVRAKREPAKKGRRDARKR